MLIELVVAALMVLVTVVIHGLGLFGLARVLRLERQEEAHRHIPPLSWRSAWMMLASVLGLFLLHGFEIWLYAGLYQLLGAVPDLRTAVYFSTITYSTIGYSDAAILPDWQLVAAIEGINGILLLGWTTAFFVRAMSILGRR